MRELVLLFVHVFEELPCDGNALDGQVLLATQGSIASQYLVKK